MPLVERDQLVGYAEVEFQSRDRGEFDLREGPGGGWYSSCSSVRAARVDLKSRAPETPVLLVGYRDRLKQSFLNVAVNALKAMPGGGHLRFEMEVQEADAVRTRELHGGMIRVESEESRGTLVEVRVPLVPRD